MRRISWLVIIGLMVYGGFMAAGAVRGEEILPANIEFSEEGWDFGTIKQGEKYSQIIELKNQGEREIKIVKVESFSKLIVISSFVEEIAAGKKAKINVELVPDEKIGKIEEYIYITIAIPLEAVIEKR